MKMKTKIIAATCALAVALSALFVSGIFMTDKATEVKSARTGDELTAEEVKTAILPKEDVPLGMSYEEAVAEGHRVRLYDQEPNDYTVIFQNKDDTRTMYYYNVPVKHTGNDGNTFDIDVSIEKSKDKRYKYTNTQNSVQLGFPKNVETGIDIVGDRDVSVKPVYEHTEAEEQTAGIVAPKGSLFVTLASSVGYLSTASGDKIEATATKEYVDYKNAFGPDTTLRCTPVVNGVKQDVILDKNINENAFSFDFDFGNQELVEEEDGTLSVYDNESDEVTGYITPIKVYDAEGTEAEDCYYSYEKTETGEWRITANVNEEFLDSADTVYPVTVDPDYIDTPEYGLKDAVVSSGEPNTNYGSATSLYIGNNSNARVMRVLIGFSKLDLSNIDPSQMYSASFSLKDIVQSTSALTIEAYEYLNSWSESTVTWNSSGMSDSSNYGASPVDTQVISKSVGENNKYPHRYYISIKGTAKKWCQYKHYQSYGFMLKSSSESTARYCTFGSYEASSNKPTLVFRYYPPEQTVANGTYYLKNYYSSKYLTRASDSIHAHNVRQNTLAGTSAQRWTIEYYADGYYYLHEEDNSGRNLKIEGGSNGDNIRTAESNPGSEYQLYRIIQSKYGYRIMSKKYPLQCVQIASAVTTESTNVMRADYDKGKYQEWVLQKESTIPEKMTVTPATATIVVGQTKQLTKSISPSTAPQTTIWTSSNTGVATVSATGLVTAKATGTATITTTATGYPYAKDTCVVTVLNKPDLTVSALSCPEGIVDQPLDISATVKNVNSTAAASYTKFEVKNSSNTVVHNNSKFTKALSAGATENLTDTWTPDTPGTYTITATADYNDAVDETNENNNTRTITAVIGDADDAEDGSRDGANPITFNKGTIDNSYGSIKSVDITDHYIYKSGDVDYYKLEEDNLIMLEIVVPENLTVSVVEVVGGNEIDLGSSSTAGAYLKVKTTLNPCYIKVTSDTVGGYTLEVNAYTEK